MGEHFGQFETPSGGQGRLGRRGDQFLVEFDGTSLRFLNGQILK